MAEDSSAEQWRLVDEGWGRRAVDFATLSEPHNAREYTALHQHLAVGAGDRLLDVACGSGLALELAAARGAECAGLDASTRLVAVAQDRLGAADVRVGDMHALPWSDDSFDVVTSFRGIWGTTPDAVAEVLRVLRPGGRFGLTVWGHIKASPGAWALQPFTLADEGKVANQAAMVRLGRPGAGEELLDQWGFVDVRRVEIPFAWEFPDPEAYARALASTGPAYEAIKQVGDDHFHEYAVALAAERVRDGLPLRAEILVTGYVAKKPSAETSPYGFLDQPLGTDQTRKLHDDDRATLGYVMNATHLWGRAPELNEQLFNLLGGFTKLGRLTLRQRGILVAATASTFGDSYCSLAWGGKLADAADPGLAGAVLTGTDEGLAEDERALATWARQVTRDPNGITLADVQGLRAAGFDQDQVFAITGYVALRIAFSTVNDALGARPDKELAREVPSEVRDAVRFGRLPVREGPEPEKASEIPRARSQVLPHEVVDVARWKVGLATVGEVSAAFVEGRRLELPGVELGPAAPTLAGLLFDLGEESPAESVAPVARTHPHRVDRQPLPHVDGAPDAAAQQAVGTVHRIRGNRPRLEVVRLEAPTDELRRLPVVLDEAIGDLVLATPVRAELDAPVHGPNVSYGDGIGQSDSPRITPSPAAAPVIPAED